MTDTVIAASLLWAMFFGLYAIFGVFITVAPAVVVRTADLQQQSARFLKRLPIIAVALWVVLFVINWVYPLDLCSWTCDDQTVRFPWQQ
ncbi:MAG TPA: hypothetical protein VF282_00155 [Bacillota bacterium]